MLYRLYMYANDKLENFDQYLKAVPSIQVPYFDMIYIWIKFYCKHARVSELKIIVITLVTV